MISTVLVIPFDVKQSTWKKKIKFKCFRWFFDGFSIDNLRVSENGTKDSFELSPRTCWMSILLKGFLLTSAMRCASYLLIFENRVRWPKFTQFQSRRSDMKRFNWNIYDQKSASQIQWSCGISKEFSFLFLKNFLFPVQLRSSYSIKIVK